MRLADDNRGRVPFALIGVLLLLGSTTYATTLATDGLRLDRDVEVAMDRATAASETALRVAVSDAARDAAATPVTVPAESRWGAVLDDSQLFRESLRVRIYVAARTGFSRASYTRGDVTAAATLPATPTPRALDQALDRVTLAAAENGTALRVTLTNVSVVAREDGHVVARETTNRTVTVATPVLALHDRTVRFERSLDRGPLEGRGLGRRLTARLYPLTWARGYAQWGGAPISNVLSTRHVGITANGAILELQREAYGRSDPTGRERYGVALRRLAAQDLSAGLSTPATNIATSALSDPSFVDPDDTPSRVPQLAPANATKPNETTEIRVGDTADRAFVALKEGTHGPSLDETLDRAYEVDARLRTTADLVETEPWPRPQRPGPDVTFVNESVDRTAMADAGTASLPPTVPGWTRFETATREVTVFNRITWTWQDGNRTKHTSATVIERYAVGLAVDGSLPSLNGTPTVPVVPAYERGGVLDGPNLAGVPDQSTAFLNERGGVDAVASRRARDGPEALDRTGILSGERPDDLDEWVERDVLSLQREVRNLSTKVRMDEAASARANPRASLATKLQGRRTSLLDASTTYDGAADRARVVARAVYLDRVQASLEAGAHRTRDANDALVDRLLAEEVDLAGRATDILTNRSAAAASAPPVDGPLGGEDVFVPQGGPAYLDVRGVDGADANWTRRTDTQYPLATRNINVFTVPYGDAVDAVVGSATVPERVRLHTAAMTLRTAERAADSDRQRLRSERIHLESAVSNALVAVERRTEQTLAEETRLSRHERRRVVARAFGRWNRTSAKALAVTNGSFVPAVVAATGVDGVAADRLRIRLRVTIADVRSSPDTHVRQETVNSTATAIRRISTTAATEAVGTLAANGTERLASRLDGRAVVLPAGLPLLPTPTNWYATVNVWVVNVTGQYPRFAVRTPRGRPGETVTYVRDGGDATVDVDGDGVAERLGHAPRVDFSVRTVVLVAVPPGKTGVGDLDGQAHETSPGWGK